MDNNEINLDAKVLTPWKQVMIAVAVPVIFVAAVATIGGLGHGRPIVEKILRNFALPGGVVWLGMLFLTAWCLLKRQRALGFVAGFLFLLHGAFGGDYVCSWLCETLESEYQFVNLETAPRCDVIVVLGGGVYTSGPDHIALTALGDRIVLAVRLFHADKTDLLVFTGEQHKWDPSSLSIADGAAVVATQLGVPDSAVSTLPGRNTFEEFQSIKSRFSGQENLRIGLVTSATHMPRAMRLAASVGVELLPIPADFERDAPLPLSYGIIPGGGGYQASERAVVEYLAWLVGR